MSNSAPAVMPLSSSSSSASSTPSFTLQKGRNTSIMRIGDWTIMSSKRPILNGREIEAAEKRLCFPLPEMTFGNNHLSLVFCPSPSSSSSASASSSQLSTEKACKPEPASSSPSNTTNMSDRSFRMQPNLDSDTNDPETRDPNRVEIKFDTLDSLAGVAVGEGWEEKIGGGVLVSMAEHWGRNRPKSSAFSQELPSKPVRPHDWTYSSIIPGTTTGCRGFERSEIHSIPMQLLSRQDPVLDKILFYEDVPLFEDELHDNGESILNVRIRVMPHSFFVLARHFLRVDNVLFRMFDVRVYHAFGSGEVIREISGMEASYDDVKSKLESQNDLSPLTNPNFVSQAMLSLLHPSSPSFHDPSRPERPSLKHSFSSASRGGKPWPGLGSRIEVLKLGSQGIDGAVEGFGRLDVE